MIQTKPPTTIYLSVGGFIIKIMRIPRMKKVFPDEPILDIHAMFKGFIIRKAKKIDHTIIIERNSHPSILQKIINNKTNNLLYFYQEEKDRTKTFSHIGEFQFKFILSGILLRLLSENGGFVLHASGALLEKKVTLFVGKSGAGKSTAVKLLRNRFIPIADDSIIIRRLKSRDYHCYQVPFPEKNNFKRGKKGYKISKILFLKKSLKMNLILLRDKQLVWKKLSQQMFTETLYTKTFLRNLINFIDQFNTFYTFSFFIDEKEMGDFFKNKENNKKQCPHLHQDLPITHDLSSSNRQESHKNGYEIEG